MWKGNLNTFSIQVYHFYICSDAVSKSSCKCKHLLFIYTEKWSRNHLELARKLHNELQRNNKQRIELHIHCGEFCHLEFWKSCFILKLIFFLQWMCLRIYIYFFKCLSCIISTWNIKRPIYVTLDHKTSHKGQFYEIDIYNLKIWNLRVQKK